MKMKIIMKEKAKRFTIRLIKVVFITITCFSVFHNLTAQTFPSGGYQGGGLGNITIITWSGDESSDWSDPANWCPAVVPDEDDDVVIPASATVIPEVKVSGMSCKSVTVEPGAGLTIKPGYILTVNGKPLN